MPDTKEHLRHLAQLSEFLKTCHVGSVRERVVFSEIAQREQQAKAAAHQYPEIELRWLYYKLQALRDLENSVEYGSAAFACEHAIGDFVVLHKDINSEEKLEALIAEQKEVILDQCIQQVVLQTLRNYQADPGNGFSEAEVLHEIQHTFQLKMLQEDFLEFETECLIHRHRQLQKRVIQESSPGNYEAGFMTLNTSIWPEIKFIQSLLNQTDLKSFKLAGSRDIWFDFSSEEFSKEGISASLTSFFNEKGTTNIDARVSDQKFRKVETIPNKIEKRTFNEYLNNPEYISCLKRMSDTYSELNELLASLGKKEPLFPPKETKDRRLLDLRDLVKGYSKELANITEREKKLFPNRRDESLERRRDALTALSHALNQAESLTKELQLNAKELVMEIKNNEPKWSELSFIDKLLDVLTAGFRVLYRNSMYKEVKEKTDLYQAVEKDDVKAKGNDIEAKEDEIEDKDEGEGDSITLNH